MDRLDREQLRKTFASYVKNYNLEDPKINLKVVHTYKVADLCERIGKSLGLSGFDLDTAWACGMLHDIGRFEQIRRFGTFVDAKSIDHALLSTQILFGESEGRIREFVNIPDRDAMIEIAVRWHSAYRLPDDLDDQTKTYCQILRDADKLDIFRVNLETSLEEIYNVTSEELYHCRVTPEVMEAFYEHHAVLRSLKKTPIDNLVGHICLTYELVYDESRKIALEQGYLEKLMEFESEDAQARVQMNEIRSHMQAYLSVFH